MGRVRVRAGGRARVRVRVRLSVRACVCVCVRERESESEGENWGEEHAHLIARIRKKLLVQREGVACTMMALKIGVGIVHVVALICAHE